MRGIHGDFGNNEPEQLRLYYTLDTTLPTDASIPYERPIVLEETTWVRVAIYTRKQKIGEHGALFQKGKRSSVIDLAHGNKILELDVPIGPFHSKIIGMWQEGESMYDFGENGECIRVLANGLEQPIGYWWYDFPLDFFEAQDYAGTGEIWFLSGERQSMRLLTQEGDTLELDNAAKGLSTAYGGSDKIQFRQIKQ
ncbi:MAG: FN3 associated domain-containing protein [Cellulosilyticaceae bacterium]